MYNVKLLKIYYKNKIRVINIDHIVEVTYLNDYDGIGISISKDEESIYFRGDYTDAIIEFLTSDNSNDKILTIKGTI